MIKINDKNTIGISHGDRQYQAAYVGEQLVWSKGDSLTPMVITYTGTSVTISVQISQLCDCWVVFGDGYKYKITSTSFVTTSRTYTDGIPTHYITFDGDIQFLKEIRCESSNVKAVDLGTGMLGLKTVKFRTSQITSFVVPETYAISYFDFYNCTLLSELIFNHTLQPIDTLYFDCQYTKITSVTLPAGTTNASNIFIANCTEITALYAQDLVIISGNVTGNYSAKFTTLSLPCLKSCNSISFTSCQLLTSVNLESLETVQSIYFDYCYELSSLNLPKLITAYYVNVFGTGSKVSKLQSLSMPVVETISIMLKLDYTLLTTLSCPQLKTVGGFTATYCSQLQNVSFPELTQKTGTVSSSYFRVSNCANFQQLSAPKLTYSGRELVLSGCPKLTVIDFPLLTRVDNGNLSYDSGAYLTYVNLPALQYVNGTLEIRGTTATYINIGSLTFCKSANLYSNANAVFTFHPDLVTTSMNISNCTQLTSIILSESNNLTTLYAQSCPLLHTVVLPPTCPLSTLYLLNCNSLSTLTMPVDTSAATLSSNYQISYATIGGHLTIPRGNGSYTEISLSYMSNVTGVSLIDGITTVASLSLNSMMACTSLSLPSTLSGTINGVNAYYCGVLDITIPEGVTWVKNINTTYSNTASISFPSTLNNALGINVSYSKIESITVPSGVPSVTMVSSNCAYLHTVNFANAICNSMLFDNCANLVSLLISPLQTTATTVSVAGCTSLVALNLQAISSVSNLNITSCLSLTSITANSLVSVVTFVGDQCHGSIYLPILQLSTVTGIYMRRCGFSAAEVDQVIESCLVISDIDSSGTLYINNGASGTLVNSAPSATGVANAVLLRGKGWTVAHV